MPGNRILHPCTAMVILLLGTGWPAGAQEHELSQQAESALYQDEAAELPVLLFERMEEYKQNPIDLNRATRDQLFESGLFTPFQVELFLRYRERYGPLFSIYELAGLSGFRRTRLIEISSCITAGSGTVNSSRTRRDVWALIEGSTSLPVTAEYLPVDSLHPNTLYPGDPFRVKSRIRVQPTRYLSLGAAYEKDPGERFISEKKPEFLSGYISYQGSRWLNKLVAGTFRIHHGLGLVNGTGLIHALNSFSLQPLSVPTLSPSSSLAESKYEQGLACQMSTGRFRYLCWSSLASIDLSLFQYQPVEGSVDWEERERTSGLHRTKTELGGSTLAFRFHQGGLVSWRRRHLRIEAMTGVRVNGLTRAGKDSLRTDPGLSSYAMGSLYGGWSGERLRLAAEWAATGRKSIAVQMVAGYRFSDYLSGLLVLHDYGPRYRGMFPSSYGSGSKLQNEQGVALTWHLEAYRYVVADLLIELFRFPDPRLNTSVPSYSYRFGWELRNAGNHSYSWKIRVWKKGWQQSGHAESPGTAPLELSEVTRMDLQFRQTAGENLQCYSRLILSRSSLTPGKGTGYAVAQQITWAPCVFLKTTVQFVVFRVSEWNNRIYMYEPGLYYHFQFPVCYGSGEKIAAVFTLKPGKILTFSWKIGTQVKHSAAASASRDLVSPWHRKWDLALQIRLNL